MGRHQLALVGISAAIAAACGGTASDRSSPDASSGGGGDASASGGAAGAAGDGTGGINFGGFAGGAQDAASDQPSITVSNPGPFDCLGCACDSATSYCFSVSAGIFIPPAPDASACGPPNGNSGCAPLPAKCAGVPSCDCLPSTHTCTGCEDVGGGLMARCAAP